MPQVIYFKLRDSPHGRVLPTVQLLNCSPFGEVHVTKRTMISRAIRAGNSIPPAMASFYLGRVVIPLIQGLYAVRETLTTRRNNKTNRTSQLKS